MTEYSKVTLEPMPDPVVIFRDMVQFYLYEKGYADLFDAYKTLLPIKPEEIGIQLFSAIEDANLVEMPKNGRCPDCGCELILKVEPRTRDYPGAEWFECPECTCDFKLSEVG